MSNKTLVNGRTCSGCTMCCKLPEIPALEKPLQVVCKHCTMGVGCNIYEDRPQVCRDFYCGYMLYNWLSEDWKPSKCRMVIISEAENRRFVIHVDRDRKGLWKKEPYYSVIKNLSKEGVQSGFQVLIRDGEEMVGVLPHADKYLGLVRADQRIVTTLNGPVPDIFVVD